MKRGSIIAIDGPAGSGKSTLARLLAEKLRFTYIDTGAMYRAVAVKVHEEGIDIEDEDKLKKLCSRIRLHFEDNKIFVDGRDYSNEIRKTSAGPLSSKVSTKKTVREAMVRLQRSMAENSSVVMEGRDIGTVVFPDADVKFYLDASAEIRGKRRYLELKEKGSDVSLGEVIEEVKARDKRDSTRALSPLKKADDAIHIDTSNMEIEDVVKKMVEEIESHQTQDTGRKI
ncbi:MAG: (d)CMP kinase [Deltaproteobacteria bacterium]